MPQHRRYLDEIDFWQEVPWGSTDKQIILIDAVTEGISLQDAAQRRAMEIYHANNAETHWEQTTKWETTRTKSVMKGRK